MTVRKPAAISSSGSAISARKKRGRDVARRLDRQKLGNAKEIETRTGRGKNMPKKNLMLKVWAWGSVRRWCRVHLQRRSTFWGMGRDYYRHYANGEEAWGRAGILAARSPGRLMAAGAGRQEQGVPVARAGGRNGGNGRPGATPPHRVTCSGHSAWSAPVALSQRARRHHGSTRSEHGRRDRAAHAMARH